MDAMVSLQSLLDRKLPDMARTWLKYFLCPASSLSLLSDETLGAYRIERAAGELHVVPLDDLAKAHLGELIRQQREVEAAIDGLSDEQLIRGFDALAAIQ